MAAGAVSVKNLTKREEVRKLEKELIRLNNTTLATARTSLAHRPYSTKVGVFFKASRWVGNSDVQESGFQASGGSL